MKQYISKDALIAEIDRQKIGYNIDGKHSVEYDVTRKIIDIINTLEVKEEPVSKDLEEAARKVGQKYFPDEENIWARPNYEAKKAEYAFMEGANWQKEQMIDKACEWLKSYRQDTPDGTGYIPGIINDKTIEDFKQSMED